MRIALCVQTVCVCGTVLWNPRSITTIHHHGFICITTPRPPLLPPPSSSSFILLSTTQHSITSITTASRHSSLTYLCTLVPTSSTIPYFVRSSLLRTPVRSLTVYPVLSRPSRLHRLPRPYTYFWPSQESYQPHLTVLLPCIAMIPQYESKHADNQLQLLRVQLQLTATKSGEGQSKQPPTTRNTENHPRIPTKNTNHLEITANQRGIPTDHPIVPDFLTS